MGFKTTILLDRKLLVNLVDRYKNGSLSWDEFSNEVKAGHADKMCGPTLRRSISGDPVSEDYFYANPQECLQPTAKSSEPTQTLSFEGNDQIP